MPQKFNMIQRAQSIYLAAVIIILLLVSLGIPLFTFQGADNAVYTLNASGVKLTELEGLTIIFSNIPFYFGGLVLILLSFLCLVMFKNLKRQLSVARFTAMIYFISLVALGFAAFLGTYFTKEETVTVSLGIGFYLFLIGFPLLLLAIRGIKKDKDLIDSVNRLR